MIKQLLSIFLFGLLATLSTRAAVVIDIQETVGGDVTVTLAGNLDLTGSGTASFIPFSPAAVVDPSGPFIIPSTNGVADNYANPNFISVAGSFGTGSLVAATTQGGSSFGISTTEFFVPQNYNSFDALSGLSTYVGTDFLTLGITPNVTVVWTLASNDTVTVNTIPVPEPSTWIALVAAAGCGAWMRRRRLG